MDPSAPKDLRKIIVILLLVGFAALAVTLIIMATIGDDVPTELAPSTQTSPGN
jgi:hypothetical protein